MTNLPARVDCKIHLNRLLLPGWCTEQQQRNGNCPHFPGWSSVTTDFYSTSWAFLDIHPLLFYGSCGLLWYFWWGTLTQNISEEKTWPNICFTKSLGNSGSHHKTSLQASKLRWVRGGSFVTPLAWPNWFVEMFAHLSSGICVLNTQNQPQLSKTALRCSSSDNRTEASLIRPSAGYLSIIRQAAMRTPVIQCDMSPWGWSSVTCHQGDRLAAAVRCDAITAMSWSVGQWLDAWQAAEGEREGSAEREGVGGGSRSRGGSTVGASRSHWLVSPTSPAGLNNQPPDQSQPAQPHQPQPAGRPTNQTLSKTSQHFDNQAGQKREYILKQLSYWETFLADISVKHNLSKV